MILRLANLVDIILMQQGFRSHVKYDHNMWNYIYYSLYLDNIDTGDHNAIQKYVYELVSPLIELSRKKHKVYI